MKKIFLSVCAIILLFTGTVFADRVEFPNGITVDVAPGWSHKSEGESVILTADDESCVITIAVTDAKGASAKDAAAAMSEQHKGSLPEQISDDFYLYSFKNESGADCTVSVGVENEKLKIVAITGDHDDVEGILDSIEEK